MELYKQTVKAAADAFQRVPELSCDAVKGLWNDLEWVVNETPEASPVDLSLTEPVMTLSPSLLTSRGEASNLILVQFGALVLRSGGEDAVRRWEKKLVLPDEAHVHTFSQKLASSTLRSTCHSYRDLLATYPNVSNSVPKLVGVNLANALIANNVSYADSRGVNVYEWGPTFEYANRRKLGSIVPLTSAFCPPSVDRSFGHAFASLSLDQFAGIKESSVKKALTELMQDICELVA